MFGPSIALAIGAKFVPLRKPRKLPGKLNEKVALKQSFHCSKLEIVHLHGASVGKL